MSNLDHSDFFRADLHCHTTCSDGTVSPKDIIKLAQESNLQGLSITDHDTVSAYAEAQPIANQLGIRLLPGIEFSSYYKEHSIHLLGYSFAVDHPAILALCARHANRRTDRNQMILNNLKKLGIPVSIEELLAVSGRASSVGRPHIAQVLMNKGYVTSIQDAFTQYLAEGAVAYSPGPMISLEETLDVLQQAKAIAILAHPHLIKQKHLLHEILQLSWDGLEVYYGNFTAVQNRFWQQIAADRGWLATGGSDFHGAIKPSIPLGISTVSAQTFNVLWDQYQSNLVSR